MVRTTHYDAIIIGAGVIGCALAFEMGKQGYRTLNVDKLPAAGYGSTASSGAIIRCHYSTWAGVALSYEGFHFWKEWTTYLGVEDERGLARFVQCGMLALGGYDRYLKKVIPLFDEIGIPYELWSPETMRERIPGIDTGRYAPPRRPDDDLFWEEATAELADGFYTPVAGYVTDPQLAAHNLQRAAESRGGEFLFNARVTAITRTADRVTGVELEDGTSITAPVVVNVAGPHSSVVNRLAGIESAMGITTRPLRQEAHHVPAPAGVDWEGEGLVIGDDDLGIYSRPEVGNNFYVGSLEPECDPLIWVDDPDHFDRTVQADQWRAQVLRLARRFPRVGIPHERRGVVDLYDVSDDWIPIYDKTDLGGYYLAIGTSGNQFKNCHVAAYCLTRLIEAVSDGHDHDADPLRVTLPHTGLELGMGSFSRNREINRDSSFSVLG